MTSRLALLVALLLLGASARAETIVLLRHGEKPPAGLGQLDCQGLNRALALPPVLARLFGRPAAIFVPDPGIEKRDGGIPYFYVRPLATIEPTAIALGMPVQAGIGIDDLDRLDAALRAPALRDATVFVAWEHHGLEAMAARLLREGGGDPAQVPRWKGSDYDSLYVVRTQPGAPATFAHLHEGLDGQPETCPR